MDQATACQETTSQGGIDDQRGSDPDKMLDAFNLYRQTGDPKHMETAQKYAALLKVDRSFRGFHTRPRGRIIDLGALG